MPMSTTSLPSGNTARVRRVASMKNLTESQASSIGLANYYHRYAVELLVLSVQWISHGMIFKSDALSANCPLPSQQIETSRLQANAKHVSY